MRAPRMSTPVRACTEACARAQVQAAQHAAQQQTAMGPPQPQPPLAQAHAAQAGQQRSGALMPFNFLLMPEMASLQDGARPPALHPAAMDCSAQVGVLWHYSLFCHMPRSPAHAWSSLGNMLALCQGALGLV